MGHVVFLSGPVGSGKTTLGKALAARTGAAFIDGDDHHIVGRSWQGSSLSTSRAIIGRVTDLLNGASMVVVAYPIRRRNALQYRSRLAAAGAEAIFVGLRASETAILAASRTRIFSEPERSRVREMVAQGYGAWSFHDLFVDTGDADVPAAVETLVQGLRSHGAAMPC